MELFPIMQPEMYETPLVEPPDIETAWDFENDVPIWKNGKPVIVEGLEAVRVWAWNALHTVRARWPIYTWDYGCDLERLIGQAYTEDIKKMEAVRYVQECLMIHPSIREVKDIVVEFDGEKLDISCTVVTKYGEMGMEV